MRNVVSALTGAAFAAALATAASAQTPPTQSPDRPATDEGTAQSGDRSSSPATDKDKDRKPGTTTTSTTTTTTTTEKSGSDAAGTSATSASSRSSDTVTKDSPLRLRAFAVDTNGSGSATATLDIVIERWSTDAERDQLRGVLVEKGGGDALLSAVQKIKPRAGFIRTTSSTGWDIQFARETTMSDGTRRIVFGTDRPMSFWEAANRPRSADYQFMVGEVRIDKSGKGQGRLVPAAAVGYDEETRTLEVENYDTLPVNLTQVLVVDGRSSR